MALTEAVSEDHQQRKTTDFENMMLMQEAISTALRTLQETVRDFGEMLGAEPMWHPAVFDDGIELMFDTGKISVELSAHGVVVVER